VRREWDLHEGPLKPKHTELLMSMGHTFFGSSVLSSHNDELFIESLNSFMSRLPKETFALRGGRVEITNAPVLEVLKSLFRGVT
jgi:hypothetical protein